MRCVYFSKLRGCRVLATAASRVDGVEASTGVNSYSRWNVGLAGFRMPPDSLASSMRDAMFSADVHPNETSTKFRYPRANATAIIEGHGLLPTDSPSLEQLIYSARSLPAADRRGNTVHRLAEHDDALGLRALGSTGTAASARVLDRRACALTAP